MCVIVSMQKKMADEPLLEETKNKYVMFPIEYPDVFDMYKQAQSAYWTADEINFAQDLTDLDKLNSNEKHFINHVLAFFAASDGIVMENLSQRFANDIPKSEVRAFYAFQDAMEAVHCVAPETRILTKKGYQCIKDLKDQQVEVWNGECWSQVTVKKTSDNSKLVNVKLSNGMNLECTLAHKWFVHVGDKVLKIETQDLHEGDIIAAYKLPMSYLDDPDYFQNPYTHGFFCGETGSHPNKYTNDINKEKFTVPVNYSVETKLRWLEGYLDADGCISGSQTSVKVTSVHLEFLKNVQLLLTTFGVQTNIKFVRNEEGIKQHCLYIPCRWFQELRKLGLQPKMLQLSTDEQVNRNGDPLIEVTAIEDVGRMDETYCFTEPMRHAGVFNGILTGQSETYSLLIDTYVKNETQKDELFNAVRNFPAIKEKADWALQWIESKDASFAQRLVAFAIVEGLFFSASFCAIFWLRERGLLPGLSFANQLIARDESLHTEFAILLYSHLNNKVPKDVLETMMRQAVDIEMRFITESIPCSMIGMNTDLMSDYIKYIADRLLVSLGSSKIYNTTNPFAFMEMSASESKVSFFEKRNASYSKSTVSFNPGQSAIPSELSINLTDDF